MVERETILIILGAGASFDARMEGWPGGDDPIRLEHGEDQAVTLPRSQNVTTPLTKDIVNDGPIVRRLLSTYRQAGPVAAELRSQIRPPSVADNEQLAARTISLEAALERYVEDSDTNRLKSVHLLAFRFYLRDLLRLTSRAILEATSWVTNHVALLNQVLDRAKAYNRPVIIVTFNYDLLVEEALTSITGRRFDTVGSLVNGPDVYVIKPHGSVSWHNRASPDNAELRQLRGADALATARNVIGGFAEDKFHMDEFHDLQPALPATKDPGIPTLALPVESKPGIVCPDTHLHPLQARKGMITHVLAVGWRAAEDHFLDPHLRYALNRMPIKLTVVTGGQHEQAASEALGVQQRFGELLEGDIRADINTGGFARFLPEWDVDAWVAESMR